MNFIGKFIYIYFGQIVDISGNPSRQVMVELCRLLYRTDIFSTSQYR
jgi:hypothetical protein